MNDRIEVLLEIYKYGHSQAVLEMRSQKLKRDILKCSPPEPIEPLCRFEPCHKPEKLEKQLKDEGEVPK